MKKTLITTVIASLILVGCGDDKNKTASNNVSTSSTNTQQVAKKATAPEKESFEWSWLANEEAVVVNKDNAFQKNYYFVLDGSGSMDSTPGSCNLNENNKKITIAKKAVQDFVTTIPAEANVGMLAFDHYGTQERVALGVANRKEFMQRLQQVSANSGTPLKTAITEAYGKIKKQAVMQSGHGEYNIIVLTDGAADSFEDPTKIVKEIAQNSPVNIYTIGFCIGEGHSLNNPNFVNYYTANDASSIIAGLSEVLAESDESFDDSSSNQ